MNVYSKIHIRLYTLYTCAMYVYKHAYIYKVYPCLQLNVNQHAYTNECMQILTNIYANSHRFERTYTNTHQRTLTNPKSQETQETQNLKKY